MKNKLSQMAIRTHRRAFLLSALREFEAQQDILKSFTEETESDERLRQAFHNALARLDRTGA